MTDMFKLARPRLQGVSCRIVNGQVQDDVIKNKMLRDVLHGIPQFVGEIVCGSPVADDCYDYTMSHVEDEGGFFDFVFWVYDLRTTVNYGLRRRLDIAQSMMESTGPNVQFVEHELIEFKKQRDEYYKLVVKTRKFSGIVLRDAEGTYGTWDEETTQATWPMFRTVHRTAPGNRSTYRLRDGAFRSTPR